MSHTPNYDTKIKIILDNLKPQEKTCAASDRTWLMDEREIGLYKKYQMPPSPYHPEVRQKLHGATYTAFSWWWHKDFETGEKVLTHIHPHTGFQVMKDKNWFQMDATKFGRDFNLSESIFEQMYQLALTVPLSAHKNFKEPINSISRASFGDEDSVFTVASQTKRSAYIENTIDIEDSLEVVLSQNIRNSYNVAHSHRIFNCRFVRECFDCLNSWFIFDCRDCENCFGAWNKRHKKYLWFNEQLSKKDWEDRFASVQTSSRKILDVYLKQFKEALNNLAVWPNGFLTQCQNSSGDYLTNCIDCHSCWGCDQAKNEDHTIWDDKLSENNAYCLSPGSSFCYNSSAVINCANSHFCHFVSRSQNLEYCIECTECENCFGCFGLRYKKFHIFNKEYSETKYWQHLDEIKCFMLANGEYGDFFNGNFFHTPADATNGATVYEDFTEVEIKKLEILNFDHKLDGAYGDWSGREFLEISQIPDSLVGLNIAEFSQKAFVCQRLNRPFTFSPLELRLYQQMSLPLPKIHFILRVKDLWSELNMNVFADGQCCGCHSPILYSKNRLYSTRKIYCHSCYLKYLEENN